MSMSLCEFVYITLFTKTILDNFFLSSFSFSPRDHVCTQHCASFFCSNVYTSRLRSQIPPRCARWSAFPSFFLLIVQVYVWWDLSPWFHEPWSLLGIIKDDNNFWVFWIYLVFDYMTFSIILFNYSGVKNLSTWKKWRKLRKGKCIFFVHFVFLLLHRFLYCVPNVLVTFHWLYELKYYCRLIRLTWIAHTCLICIIWYLKEHLLSMSKCTFYFLTCCLY
jgi:hypothetical protein